MAFIEQERRLPVPNKDGVVANREGVLKGSAHFAAVNHQKPIVGLNGIHALDRRVKAGKARVLKLVFLMVVIGVLKRSVHFAGLPVPNPVRAIEFSLRHIVQIVNDIRLA